MIDFIKEGLKWLDVDLVRNEVQHIVPAMDPEEYPDRSDMKYYLELALPEFPMSSNFETMIRLEGREKPPIVSAGASIYEGCSFRLEELLAGQLAITKPASTGTILSTITSLTTKYKLREVIEPALLDRSLPTRTAMRAGIALRDFVGYEHSFFSRYQQQHRQFLTWHPKKKLVSSRQPEFLYFLLNMEEVPEAIKLRARITNSAGERTVITVASISGLQAFQVLCAQVGATELGLNDDCVQYEVWLSDQDDQRFTEVRTYNIDRRKHAFERHLLFSNSLGGFDTIRMLGMASQESDVVRSTSRKERETGKGLEYSELEIISIQENSGIKLSTGFFEQDASLYQDYLRELLLSEVVLLDTPFGLEAMNLITSNMEYAKDRPGLIERSFSFARTYSDINYSRMDPVELQPARATTWVGVSAKAVLDSFGKRTGKIGYERLQKVYSDDRSKVIPYAVKPNIPGDPDYIEPVTEASIPPGSTPYPSLEINRAISFRKNDCAPGYLGTIPVINITAGTYGGEAPGDANELAEAKFASQNNQKYANTYGICELNNVPVHFGIFHKIPMTGTQVTGSSDYGPVVDLRINGAVAITNTTGSAVPANRLSDNTYSPGTYNLVLSVSYGSTPFRSCKLKVAGKALEQAVTGPGFYIFENVTVNSLDEPLTIEVNPL